MSESTHDARALIGHMQEAEATRFLEGLAYWGVSPSQLKEMYRSASAAVASLPPRDLTSRATKVEVNEDVLGRVSADHDLSKIAKQGSWEFGTVEIDSLVCLQKYIDLEHARKIIEGVDIRSATTTMEFFLTERFLRHGSEVTSSESSNLFAVRAEGPDLRVVRSEQRLDEDGTTRTISYKLGWAPSPTQVVHLDGRHILKNGYHRVYAARASGLTSIPCVLIEGSAYSDLENPGQPEFFSQEKVMSDRPPIFADFFSDEISKVVKTRALGRVIVLQPEEHLLSAEEARRYLSALPSTRSPEPLSVSIRSQFTSLAIGREEWNQYYLDDGTMVYLRRVAKRAKVVLLKDGSHAFEPELSELITTEICPEKVMGPPSSERYSQERLESSITVKHLGFRRLFETTSEYVLPHNDKITVSPRLVGVSKTSLFNEVGEPIYLYETSTQTGFIRSGR